MAVFWIILAILAYGIYSLIKPIIQYYKLKPLYKKLPDYNREKCKSLLSPYTLISLDDGYYKVLEALTDNNGKFIPICHFGADGDGSHCVALTDIDAIKDVFLNTDVYIKHPVLYKAIARGVGDGLVSADGENWKLQRKLVNPVFSYSALRNMIPTMIDESVNLVENIRKKNSSSEYLDVMPIVNDATLAVLVRTGLGNEFDVDWMRKEYRVVSSNLWLNMVTIVVLGGLSRKIPFGFVQNFETSLNKIKNKVREVIKMRRQRELVGNDLLTLMLISEQDFPNQINEDLIVEQCMTFLVAGQDTTASHLIWMIYFLATNKDVQRKLHEEIDSVLGDKLMTENDMPKLKYAKQVMDETLRIMSPVLQLSRQLTQDRNICGYDIPKGTHIISMIGSLSLNDKYWENPSKFEPDRFSEGEKKDRNQFSTIPFSAGVRSCVGQKFATNEGLILLTTLAQNFEFSVDPTKTKQFSLTQAAVNMPKGLKIKFTDRKLNDRR